MHRRLNLQQRQLSYLLERCNSYATQATLVTGFAFTSFSADALKDLDYSTSPTRSFLFVLSGAVTMALSIGSVGVSSYLTGKAERLAMEVDVTTAVSLVRYRMSWVIVPYYIALLFLWACAALLVFATCHNQKDTPDPNDDLLCNVNAWLVVAVFVFLGGFVTIFPHMLIRKDVQKAYATLEATMRAQGNESAAPLSEPRLGLPGGGDIMRRPLRDIHAETSLRVVD